MAMLDVRDGVIRHLVPPGGGWTRFAGRLRGEGTQARRAWQAGYLRWTVAGDAVCAAVAGLVGYLVRFGPGAQDPTAASVWLAALLPLVWVGAMLVARAYEERFFWIGAEEFRRVSFAAVMLLAAVGTVSWALDLQVARGLVVVALPSSAVLTLAQRFLHRHWLHRQRAAGRFQQTTLLVGHRSGVAALDEQIEREACHGYRVIGCCLPADGRTWRADAFNGLPVLGDLTQVPKVVKSYGVDTVAVLPCPEMDGPELRRLGWALEDTDAELLLAPAVTDVVGPRVRIRPVSGLPLLHVERPELRGVRRLAKDVFDVTAAIVGVLLLAPVLLVIAAAVKLTSPGPVFFRQERIGRDGRTFRMLKFRSMVVDADRMVDALGAVSDGNGVLFKKKDDPRVTRIGRVLRRYSLDEVPQLFNVLKGEMSLVGPRPPLQSEVERYGSDMHRRFLVKPGLTGLWQVSGRSDLSWDDSVRIDVRYVENWSLTFDFMILWKTVGAVLRGSGAY
ncbi:Undecaprenyl-phosphate galactose phosphotransferase, WbaP/exopolysaccharide biosynthesis polyprenyl glycosylphosphotransferase [Geodermatophilus amargosae]|uniref:Undecaprenyl-phosphate galactose phosphotransferase, WbaP/exopolysaccharide biosynthesis polyprenyl glycosylphosphotransferase n=1 Tax=Geodermatophilus amargosae TaxID=1296565 RepID=A0A1I6X8B0_9ACTN|nr:Undecaprenyl-phosphate galactose phosphotransferase, WbaP/exopolysaccharide biosynthesis polyprenyl glycosylphosphotransferase [Geodermatophilus amargosae]